MNRQHTVIFFAVCLTAVVALLIGSVLWGPINPHALPVSHVTISEVMLNNTCTFADSEGEYYPWVELTNCGTSAVFLSDLCLTDNPERPDKYALSGDVLKPQEYRVIYLAGKGTKSNDHADFSINNKTATLYLYSASGKLLNSLSVTESPEDTSYGLDGDTPVWFAVATPGAANTAPGASTLEELSEMVYTGVRINEVCAVSDKDSTAFSTDWVELYNTVNTPVDLTGYRLTDSPQHIGLTFPHTVLQPGAYLLISCDADDKDSDSALWAPFSLSPFGETLYLYRADGIPCDTFHTGKQRLGVTSGRSGDDRDTRVYFDEPTPKESNSAPLLGYAPIPTADKIGGYYNSPLAVTLSVPEECEVYYSMSGSAPDRTSRKYVPGTTITISDTTVLRAVAYRDGYLHSDILTQTYFINDTHSLPILSVSTDPFSLFGGKGAYTCYNNTTLSPAVHTEYFTEEGIKEIEFDSEFRIAGGLSRTNPQKAFSLNLSQRTGVSSINYPFFDDTTITEFSHLVLRPSGSDWSEAKLRDEFCAQALKNTDGQIVQSARPVAVYLNGTYWGLYYLREKRNEELISQYTGVPENHVQLVQFPSMEEAESSLDSSIKSVIDYAVSHDLTDSTAYQTVLSQIDADSLIRYYVIETYFGNGDNINNIACYRDDRGGKWKWIVFDMDWACTAFYENRNFISQLYNGGPGRYYQNYYFPLITALFQNNEFCQQFVKTYADMMKTTLSSSRLIPILDKLAMQIKPEISHQYQRFGTPSVAHWESQISYIREFLNRREKLITQQLKTVFSLSDADWEALYH